MKRILLATTCAAALLALAAPAAHAAPAKPDALIKKAGGNFKGNNVYGFDAEIQSVCTNTGNQHTFIYKVQNDGSTKRRFGVSSASHGGSASSSFTVTYNGEDVTTAVLEGSGQLTNKLAPGEKSKPFKIEVTLSDVDQNGSLLLRGGTEGGASDVAGASWNNFGACE